MVYFPRWLVFVERGEPRRLESTKVRVQELYNRSKKRRVAKLKAMQLALRRVTKSD
jgi:hypothetical protein